MYVLAPATAVVGGLVAVKEYGMRSLQGKILLIITFGVVSWFIGEVVWTYYELIAQVDPYPSVADWFYLVGYLPLCIGLLWELKFLRHKVHKPLPYTLRLLMTMLAVLFSGIALYFGVFQAIKPEYSVLENGVAISYGVADIVLVLMSLVVIVVTIEMRGGKFVAPWWWFLSGLTCTFVADIGFAMFTPEYETMQAYYKPALDSLWIVGYLAMAYGLGRFGWLIQSARQSIVESSKRKPR
ncbi:MAG: hypothetical protein ACD_41C00385G0015 [uncultured bacterium]|nr:MAG: hypothetical protein ACD_41C00385G0015 [uncultured bacterium]